MKKNTKYKMYQLKIKVIHNLHTDYIIYRVSTYTEPKTKCRALK